MRTIGGLALLTVFQTHSAIAQPSDLLLQPIEIRESGFSAAITVSEQAGDCQPLGTEPGLLDPGILPCSTGSQIGQGSCYVDRR